MARLSAVHSSMTIMTVIFFSVTTSLSFFLTPSRDEKCSSVV
jgi:hypothetical protein